VRTLPGHSRRMLYYAWRWGFGRCHLQTERRELHIIAIGCHVTDLLNGRVISIRMDDDTPRVHRSGIIGLEVEATGKLFTRNIWLKKLQ